METFCVNSETTLLALFLNMNTHTSDQEIQDRLVCTKALHFILS